VSLRETGSARNSHYARRMSHKSVETVIGKLATDEAFRRRFLEDAVGALHELRPCGCELTAIEIDALAALDPKAIQSFAVVIDQRLQKIDLGRD
jgi:hypothetical protein